MHLIRKPFFLHQNGHAVGVHQPINKPFCFGKFITEEISESVEFTLIEILKKNG